MAHASNFNTNKANNKLKLQSTWIIGITNMMYNDVLQVVNCWKAKEILNSEKRVGVCSGLFVCMYVWSDPVKNGNKKLQDHKYMPYFLFSPAPTHKDYS